MVGAACLGFASGAILLYAHKTHKEINKYIDNRVDDLYRHVDGVGDKVKEEMDELNQEAHKCIQNAITYADEAHTKVSKLESAVFKRIGEVAEKTKKA